jgi:hypothetical protein
VFLVVKNLENTSDLLKTGVNIHCEFWADVGKDQVVNNKSKRQVNPITIQQGHDMKVRLIII